VLIFELKNLPRPVMSLPKEFVNIRDKDFIQGLMK